MSRLFDAYIFVDWSAKTGPTRVKPSKDAIWVGELTHGDNGAETYCRTRTEATAYVKELLLGHVNAGRRVLVGFDFPYGYPAGLAAHLATDDSPPWRKVWNFLGSAIHDDESNKSNRFAVASQINTLIGDGPGPFWGCPASHPNDPCLTRRMKDLFSYPFATPDGPLSRLRKTEQAMSGVQEVWKLLGAGSVGSQALLGIPRVLALRDDPAFEDVSQIWPFETGFTPQPSRDRGPWLVHAEIWPGIVPSAEIEHEKDATGAIHDQAQVRLMCRWAAAQDDAGTLGGWFDTSVLPPHADQSIGNEEGWILGCRA
jgi:hypothetical protein